MTEDTTPAETVDPADETVEVREKPGRNRFDILVGGRQAGFALFTTPAENPDDQRIFYHTVIDDAFGGRGLAGVLTRGALPPPLDDGKRLVARRPDLAPRGPRPPPASGEQGKRIVPVCPYVARWVRGHDDFADSVDRVKSVHLEAVRAVNAEADGTAS